MTDTTTKPGVLIVQIPMKIDVQQIADLFVTAFEGGSTYWLEAARPSQAMVDAKPSGRNWYEAGETYAAVVREHGEDFVLMTLKEDEEAGSTEYAVTMRMIKNGLEQMALQFPTHWADFIAENDDAITADVFLQAVLFEDVIYG